MMEELGMNCNTESLPRPRMIVCLGNPGTCYANTKHNAGWQFADTFSKSVELTKNPQQDLQAELYEWKEINKKYFLLKPLTFMNNSGYAVEEACRKLDISPSEMLLVYDCLDLELGKLRLRQRGSSGGQRGVQSIIEVLGTGEIPRLRIGIGRPEPGEEVINYVLSSWASAELEEFAKSLENAVQVTLEIFRKDWQAGLSELSKKV